MKTYKIPTAVAAALQTNRPELLKLVDVEELKSEDIRNLIADLIIDRYEEERQRDHIERQLQQLQGIVAGIRKVLNQKPEEEYEAIYG